MPPRPPPSPRRVNLLCLLLMLAAGSPVLSDLQVFKGLVSKLQLAIKALQPLLQPLTALTQQIPGQGVSLGLGQWQGLPALQPFVQGGLATLVQGLPAVAAATAATAAAAVVPGP